MIIETFFNFCAICCRFCTKTLLVCTVLKQEIWQNTANKRNAQNLHYPKRPAENSLPILLHTKLQCKHALRNVNYLLVAAHTTQRAQRLLTANVTYKVYVKYLSCRKHTAHYRWQSKSLSAFRKAFC